MRLWIITLQFQLKKQSKQTSKQSNLLTLTVSCEKRSCLIRSKKKEKKWISKQINKDKKEIHESIKMIIEAMILMIPLQHNGNDK